MNVLKPIDRRGLELVSETNFKKLEQEDGPLVDVIRALADLDNPGASAFAIMATAIENAGRHWPPSVSAIVRVLLCHQRHLDLTVARGGES